MIKVEQLLLCLTHKWVNDNSSSTASAYPTFPMKFIARIFTQLGCAIFNHVSITETSIPSAPNKTVEIAFISHRL